MAICISNGTIENVSATLKARSISIASKRLPSVLLYSQSSPQSCRSPRKSVEETAATITASATKPIVPAS